MVEGVSGYTLKGFPIVIHQTTERCAAFHQLVDNVLHLWVLRAVPLFDRFGLGGRMWCCIKPVVPCRSLKLGNSASRKDFSCSSSFENAVNERKSNGSTSGLGLNEIILLSRVTVVADGFIKKLCLRRMPIPSTISEDKFVIP